MDSFSNRVEHLQRREASGWPDRLYISGHCREISHGRLEARRTRSRSPLWSLLWQVWFLPLPRTPRQQFQSLCGTAKFVCNDSRGMLQKKLDFDVACAVTLYATKLPSARSTFSPRYGNENVTADLQRIRGCRNGTSSE